MEKVVTMHECGLGQDLMDFIIPEVKPKLKQTSSFKLLDVEVERRMFNIMINYWPEDEPIGGEFVRPCFYFPPGSMDTTIPISVMEKIRTGTYGEEDVKKWFLQPDAFLENGLFSATDEIRTIILPLIKGEYLDSVFNFSTVEKVSGEELYRKNKIGQWWQQGDVIVTPKNDIPMVTFDELTPDFLIRLRSNIWYELLSSKIMLAGTEYNAKFLKMGNASWYSEAQKYHIEMVPSECNTVMDALTFRNGTSLLPCNLA